MRTRPRIPSFAPRGELALLAAIAALALVLRLDRIAWGLPAVFEEATPFKKAWDMWGFGPLRTFDLNPHWFQYPSLTFYLQFAAQALTLAGLWVTGAVRSSLDARATMIVDPTAFYVVGRGVTALFGAATVLPVWGLARRTGGAAAAAVAALLVAVHPELIAKSQVIEVDVPLTFFVAWGLLRSVELSEAPSLRSALAAGAVAGLAASAKYPGLVLLAPMLLALAWPRRAPSDPASSARVRAAAAPPGARGARSSARRIAPETRGRSRVAERMRLAAALIGACLVTFFVTSPYLFLDGTEVARDLAIGRDLMTAGHFGVASGTAYRTYAQDWFGPLMGWPLGLAALAGLALGVARRERAALLLAALFVPFVAVVGSWQMKADRYLLPIVPIGAVCAAVLLARLVAVAPALRAARRSAIATAIGAIVLAAPLAAQMPARRALHGTDTRRLASEWIDRHLPAGALVVSELYGPDPLSPIDLQDADAPLIARLATRGAVARVRAVQQVPMFVMDPERSEKFYRLANFADADAIVLTGAVRDRYRADSGRYATQCAFYDQLAARWPRAASFAPSGGPGPAIAIYLNPAKPAPFAARGTTPPVDSTLATSGRLTGGEGFYYYNLGLNAEWFGFDQRAQEAYLLALRFGATEPAAYTRSATRLAHLLWREGRRGAAIAMLRQCRDRAPSLDVAETLAAAERELRAGRVLSVPQAR